MRLAELLEQAPDEQEEITPDVSAETPTRRELPDPEDMGDWNISHMGRGGPMVLRVKGLQIRLKDDDVQALILAFADAKPAVVRDARGHKFSFRPMKRGDEYAVKEVGDEARFPSGVLLNKPSIDTIIDMAGAQ